MRRRAIIKVDSLGASKVRLQMEILVESGSLTGEETQILVCAISDSVLEHLHEHPYSTFSPSMARVKLGSR